MSNKEIAVLVRKVQRNKKHFEVLYNETVKAIYYHCYKHLGNKEDASDVAQTVFLQLYKKIDTLREPAAFRKFLYAIMTNACADFHRAKFRDETDALEDFESMPEDNTEFLPSAIFERQSARKEIIEMIDELPQKQREAILLFYYKDLSIKEIAEITDSKFDAVNNRLVKARKNLRERAEALIEKGALDYTMAIAPIPIITQILAEEANAVVTPEVCQQIWQGVCGELGIAAAGAATTATTGALTNAAVACVCAGLLVSGGFLVHNVYNNFINPPAIVEEHEEYEEIDIVSLIPYITNRTEFMEFIDTHRFMLLSSLQSERRGNRMLFYLPEIDRYIYLGYTESLQGEFRVLYEITAERLSLTEEEIDEWFERNR